jgi:heme-degrading monooxygenase HmoA
MLGGMPLISVTRLRVRSWRFLPRFLVQALRSNLQARRADGNLGTSLLAEAHRTFWTLTAWTDETDMRTFMLAGAHGRGMRNLMKWCDEAAVAHWTQQDAVLPPWIEAHRRLQAEGRRSKVTHPTAEHDAYRIPQPVVRRRPGR